MRRLALSLTILGVAIGVMLWPLGAQQIAFPGNSPALIVPASGVGAVAGTSAVGDLLSGTGGTAFTRISDVAVNQVLTSGGVGVAPAWSGSPIVANLAVISAGQMYWQSRATLSSPADGQFTVTNYAGTIGSMLKVDTVPTVSAGFGGSPSVTAGSTPLAGEVNVGSGGIATTGTLLFNGTAFPSAPFCVCQDSTSIAAGVCKAKSTTTTLVLTTTVAWTASDLVTYVCVGAK